MPRKHFEHIAEHVVKLDASVFGMCKLNKKYWQFFSVCVGEAW